MRYFSRLAGLAFVLVLAGCTGPTQTKGESFPSMYGETSPTTILVLPAINETTAADAGDLLNVTVAMPFANHGYYVIPVPIVADIFRREGIVEGEQIKNLPPTIYKQHFGADAVLFLTVEEWDTNYAILSANVTVGMEYVLVSTTSGEVLWSYEERVVMDTSGSSGNILADVIATAISTAMADYVPIAIQVHQNAVVAMPFGTMHPMHDQDAEMKTVKVLKRDAALEQ